MPRTATLLRVLTDAHRADGTDLDTLTDRAALGGVDISRLDTLAVQIAVQLVGEDILSSPVVDHVLQRQDLRSVRHADVRFLVDRFGRAAASPDDPEAAGLLRSARSTHEQITSRTQVEVLPYLHYVYDADEQARLATLHPLLVQRTAEHYRSDRRVQAAWEDPDLLAELAVRFREHLHGEGPPRIRDDWSGTAVASRRRVVEKGTGADGRQRG